MNTDNIIVLDLDDPNIVLESHGSKERTMATTRKVKAKNGGLNREDVKAAVKNIRKM